MATVPETFVALPIKDAVIEPPLIALPETLPGEVIVASFESDMLASSWFGYT
jgi:hypothetical protein